MGTMRPQEQTKSGKRFGPWLRRETTTGALIMDAVVLSLMLFGYVTVLRDPYSDSPGLFLGIGSPTLLGAYFVIESLWRGVGQTWADGLWRMYALGSIFHLANVLVLVIVGMSMQVSGLVRASEQQSGGWDAVGQAIGAFGLLGYATLLLGSIPALLLVVLPVSAFRSPAQIPEILPVTDRRDVGRNRVGVIAFSLLLLSVFVVPTGIIFGSRYDNPTLVAVGIWFVPAVIVLLGVTVVAQRGAGLFSRDRTRQK